MASVLYILQWHIKLFELEACKIHTHVHCLIVNVGM